MKKTISFYTLGCRSNQSETAVLRNLFEQNGYTIIPEFKHSDVAVINTCTVTEKGDRDARKLVQRIKRSNPNVRVAMIGCQAQTQSEELKLFPGVRWIVGNAEKMNLISFIEEIKIGKSPYVSTPPIPKKGFTMPAPGIDKTRTRANIKIQDGCESFCSYCEVPYARGGSRSRDFDDVLKEAKQLADAGHKELVLTGINVGMYCDSGRTILDVVKKVGEILSVERIRISSIEPNTIPDDLILLMGTKTKLCRYLHIPIQSMSDKILDFMGRSYSQAEIDLFFEFVTHNVDGVCLGADVIVGFPGETEDDFDDTYEFLVNSPLAYFHVFSYSDRKLAKSRNFPNHVDPVVIQTRSAILRQLSLRKKKEFLSSFIGRTEKVLFEEKKKGYWLGLTDNYIRVKVASKERLHNELLPVHLQECHEDTLLGAVAK